MSEMVTINGRTFVAERVPVVQADQRWSEFLLADGAVIRLQVVITKVCLVPELSAEAGRPIHHWEVGFLSDVSIPVREPAAQGGNS